MPQRKFAVDPADYPFAENWFERNGTAMHYVDEGEGEATVLMLHGNPTWSYLYRHMIKALRSKCRCVAPDYPGFGHSDHPPDYDYTPMAHAEWVAALIDELALERIILVVQDWGGPIGLSIAVSQPERIAGIVLCNSWCWPPFLNARVFSWVMGGPLGPWLHLRHNFFARVMVPAGIYRKEIKKPALFKAYTDQFPTPDSRRGTYVFPREIRKSAKWLASIEDKLPALSEKPAEMVWAMRDPAFGKEYYIRKWQTFFPDAPVDRVEHASHFIQEDAPDRIVPAVERILERIQ